MFLLCGCSAQSLTQHSGLLRRCASASARASVRASPMAITASSSSFSSGGRLLSQPTRLLHQAATVSTSSTTTTEASPTHLHASDASPPVNTELHFYDTFAVSSEDVHLLLLEEAHRKHGVWRNVPPQLAPTVANIGPPIIPEPIYPLKQKQRLDALAQAAAKKMPFSGEHRLASSDVAGVLPSEDCLAYTPTHQPPPFITTGTRTLWIATEATSATTATAATTSTAMIREEVSAGAAQPQMTVTEVPVRAVVDTSMLFHCTFCGRAFRKQAAAAEHVAKRHACMSSDPAEAAATVGEGPGPGEIIRYRNVVGTSMVPASPSPTLFSAPATTTTTTSDAKKTERDAHTSTANNAEKNATGRVGGVPAATGALPQAAAKPSTASTTAATTPASTATAAPARPLQPARTNYYATPAVTLPEEDLIDDLLVSVWDDVGLKRTDIEKAAGVQQAAEGKTDQRVNTFTSTTTTTTTAAVDSCNGKFFIPSSSFVHGTADNRAAREAELASKPPARATPEGAAPGVKRPTTTGPSSSALSARGAAAAAARRLFVQRRNADGTVSFPDTGAAVTATAAAANAIGLAIAPTAQEMSIAELSRHYPNPFGDSPNAALVELEKEPVNPFRDLEGEAATAEASAAEHVKGAGEKAGGEVEQDNFNAENTRLWREWQTRFASRPYACPICQRRALPGITATLARLLDHASPLAVSATNQQTTAAATTAGEASSSRTSSAGPAKADHGVRRSGMPRKASASSSSSASAAGRKASAFSPMKDGGGPAAATAMCGTSEFPQTVGADEEAWTWYAAAVPRFRLLDALEDHLDSCHAVTDAAVSASIGSLRSADVDVSTESLTKSDEVEEEVTEHDWQRLYNLAVSPQAAAVAELKAVVLAYRATNAKEKAGGGAAAAAAAATNSSSSFASSDVKGGKGLETRRWSTVTSDGSGHDGLKTTLVADGGSADDKTGTSGTINQKDASSDQHHNDDDSDTTVAAGGEVGRDALANADAPHVHVRSAVNTVLVGVVRDVQEGFVGATRVLQYVLAISNDNHSRSSSSCNPNMTDAEAATEEDDEEDLIVVRCMGDLVPVALLRSQVHVGSTLFVTGTLRMNRNVDTASRRSHAYPYVKVVPPLGFVRAVK